MRESLENEVFAPSPTRRLKSSLSYISPHQMMIAPLAAIVREPEKRFYIGQSCADVVLL